MCHPSIPYIPRPRPTRLSQIFNALESALPGRSSRRKLARPSSSETQSRKAHRLRRMHWTEDPWVPVRVCQAVAAEKCQLSFCRESRNRVTSLSVRVAGKRLPAAHRPARISVFNVRAICSKSAPRPSRCRMALRSCGTNKKLQSGP